MQFMTMSAPPYVYSDAQKVLFTDECQQLDDQD